MKQERKFAEITSLADLKDLFLLICKEVLNAKPEEVIADIHTANPDAFKAWDTGRVTMDDMSLVLANYNIDFKLKVEWDEVVKNEPLQVEDKTAGLKLDPVQKALQDQKKDLKTNGLDTVVAEEKKNTGGGSDDDVPNF